MRKMNTWKDRSHLWEKQLPTCIFTSWFCSMSNPLSRRRQRLCQPPRGHWEANNNKHNNNKLFHLHVPPAHRRDQIGLCEWTRWTCLFSELQQRRLKAQHTRGEEGESSRGTEQRFTALCGGSHFPHLEDKRMIDHLIWQCVLLDRCGYTNRRESFSAQREPALTVWINPLCPHGFISWYINLSRTLGCVYTGGSVRDERWPALNRGPFINIAAVWCYVCLLWMLIYKTTAF